MQLKQHEQDWNELAELDPYWAILTASGKRFGRWIAAILFVFVGYSKHTNFVVTPSTREVFAAELTGFTTGKGSVQLRYGDPVPPSCSAG